MSRAPAILDAPPAGHADTGRRGLPWTRLFAGWRLPLAALTALALGIRLYELRRRSLWQDELNSLAAAALPLPDFLAALQVESNMALYYWALFAWLRLVGLGADEVLVRLPSVILGAASVPLAFLLGRRLHSTAAGLGAAALLAVQAFHGLMSQEARSYALLVDLTLLSYLLLDRALESGRRRDWLLHGLVSALAFYCHSYTLLVLLAQGVFVLSRRSWPALRGLLLSGALTALLLAQAVPFFLRNAGGGKLAWIPPLDRDDLQKFVVDFGGGIPWTLALYAALVALGLALPGPSARRPGYRAWLLLTWLIVPIGLALAISIFKPVFMPRYLLGTLPALCLLAGIGLARLPRPLALAGLAANLALTLSLFQGGRYHARPVEEWREAAAYATQRAEPGDGWVFVQKRSQSGFEFYADWRWGRNPDAPYADVFEPFDWRAAFSTPRYRGIQSMPDFERFVAEHPRLWLIQSHETDPETKADTAAPVRQYLSRAGYTSDARQFRGPIRVVLYQRG